MWFCTCLGIRRTTAYMRVVLLGVCLMVISGGISAVLYCCARGAAPPASLKLYIAAHVFVAVTAFIGFAVSAMQTLLKDDMPQHAKDLAELEKHLDTVLQLEEQAAAADLETGEGKAVNCLSCLLGTISPRLQHTVKEARLEEAQINVYLAGLL